MREESGKLFRSRIVRGLLLLSVIINAYLLWMQKDQADVLELLDTFCGEYGSAVTEEKMSLLAAIWNKTDTREISWEEFERQLEWGREYYESVQSSDMAAAYCSEKYLSGKAAEYVLTQFRGLEGAIREAAEQEFTFFPPYRMHIFDILCTYLLYGVNLEGIVIAIIITLYCIEMERSSRTFSTIYSTRKGKAILKNKLLASVAVSVICFLVIAVATFLLAGCFFPVKTILNTMVSNPLVNVKGAPCIMREQVTVGVYIVLNLGISCVLVVIYSLGSFWLGVKMENGYYAFGILIMLLGVMKLLSAVAPASNYLYFLAQYNPLDMALKAGTWLLYGGSTFSPPGYEGWTLGLWMAACIAGCARVLRKSQYQNKEKRR